MADAEGQGIVGHIHARTLDEEVMGTVKKILEIMKKDKTATYNDFAVLVRANDTANPFIKAFERAGLPYQFLASKGLYAKPVVLDVIAYFKLLDNYHESPAVYRILNLPFLEIPYDDIVKITQYGAKNTKSLYETIEMLPLVQGISEKTRDTVSFILSLIKKHGALARERSVSAILVSFLDESGYLRYLVNRDDQDQLDLLSQFYRRIKSFEETALEPSLREFMEEITFEIESGEQGKLEFDPEQGPDMIKVMTIHGAKGLEFKYVFLVNMVDRRFPTTERKDLIELPEDLIKDIKPKCDVHLQEERRICYVAMTRAKKELYFTSAEDYGGARKKRLSRFMVEMGYKDEVEIKSKKSENGLLAEKSVRDERINKKPKFSFLPSHFSFSQLTAFEKCPLQYKFAFILKVPVKGKASFSFGKTMHATLQDFLKQVSGKANQKQENLFGLKTAEPKKGGSSSLTLIQELYEKNWIGEWYENKKQQEEYYQLGKKIIKEFYNEFSKNPPKILKINNEFALEMPFNLKVNGYTLRGVIDRIDGLDGGVAITDYKTGNAKEKLETDDKDQLLIYQIAAKEVFNMNPKELIYHYLNNNRKVSFLGTEKEIAKMKEKIIQEIEEIKTSDFKATPGWQCAFCDFKDICDFAER